MVLILKCLNSNTQQHEPQLLQDVGFTHISFYIESDAFEHVLERVKQAGGEPLSEPHSNTKYEIQRIIKLFIFERHGKLNRTSNCT